VSRAAPVGAGSTKPGVARTLRRKLGRSRPVPQTAS